MVRMATLEEKDEEVASLSAWVAPLEPDTVASPVTLEVWSALLVMVQGKVERWSNQWMKSRRLEGGSEK
jgi:hypothetical protein